MNYGVTGKSSYKNTFWKSKLAKAVVYPFLGIFAAGVFSVGSYFIGRGVGHILDNYFSNKDKGSEIVKTEEERVKSVEKEEGLDESKTIDELIETEYGPVFVTTAGPNEIETNEKYEVVTPSQLEENIALSKNKNLKLNQAEYSVFKIKVNGNKFFVYNPILSDDEDDGNLYMTIYKNVYKLFPDNERSDDNGKYIERLKDEEGNFLKVDLDYILSNSDLQNGQLVLKITEIKELGTENREQQNTIFIYDPNNNDVLVPLCLNPNIQYWQIVDQEPYSPCRNTKDSYLIHGKLIEVPKIIEEVPEEKPPEQPPEEPPEKPPEQPPEEPPEEPPGHFENNDDSYDHYEQDPNLGEGGSQTNPEPSEDEVPHNF